MVTIIKCPHCGAEYLFEEIFMSDDIIGKRTAVKDSTGHIQYILKEEPDMFTTYVCDYCNKEFKVVANIETTCEKLEDEWSDDDYVVEIFKDRINLEE